MKARKIVVALLLVILFLGGSGAYAQFSLSHTKNITDRIYVGGSGGISLGSGGGGIGTDIQIAPFIGYKIFSFFSVGAGVSYQYAYYKDEHINVFGGNVFAQATPLDYLVAHVEYELKTYKRSIKLNGEKHKERTNADALNLGAGYRQRVSDHMYAYTLILWNVLQDKDDLTDNPSIRVGVTFGL